MALTADVELIARRTVHRGRFIEVHQDDVRLPNGNVITLDHVQHPGAAAVVALTDTDEVVLVRQYRHVAGQWLLEVPAGKLDAGESPQQCALRELEEETGLRAREWVPLGAILTSPGFCNEQIWLYLARDLTTTAQRLDSDEMLSVVRLSWPEAMTQALSGALRDSKTVCALLRAAEFLGRL